MTPCSKGEADTLKEALVVRKNLKITTAFLATGALALGLSACGGSESDSVEAVTRTVR